MSCFNDGPSGKMPRAFLVFFYYPLIQRAMLEVSINQEKFHVPDSGTLADVLPLLQIRQPDGIAIAVNENVIPKGEWEKYQLKEQDKVFVIRATQGG
jgi:sulfur carrier protein